MTTALTDAVTAQRIADQRRAARALLRKPLLRADGAEGVAFVLVTRHLRELREWFDRETGWRLVVNSEVARLVKTVPGTADHTHPALDRHRKIAFSRRRYVVTCLALAVLERADSQITLGRLAEHIVAAAADPGLVDAGVAFTLGSRDERGDLVAAARLLLELGVLTRVAGEEQAFVDNTGDVLYDVRRRITSALLTTTRGPSMVSADSIEDRLDGITAELPAATDEQRNRRIRFRLTRILLDEPVLYYDTLAEPELAYFTRQRSAICGRIQAFTGLVAETRAEGIAMVDPADDLTDVRMPEIGTDGHVTLLVAEWLSRDIGTCVPVADLRGKVARIAADHVRRRVWKRASAEDGAEAELVETAIRKLEALRLVQRSVDGVRPLPAISRYALAEPTVSGSRSAGANR
ncbi:TIGR02678 family protein [Antrihabitans spumae]|uniref:TIGR02678 family protein n=1 Tax=Antrihabitans spumae TaxID=3373370 RepID=A0ABW7KLP1_9NOCA